MELAANNINTILVSLPNENLSMVNQEIMVTHGVDSHFFELDMTKPEELDDFTELINERFEIFLLINNAGIGGTMKFDHAQFQDIDNIIKLNVWVVSVMAHKILPNLLRQPKGFMLNVSSIAAGSPMGYKTVYPASKAFVNSFSLGLSEELKDTNVSVSVVNPGPMATNAEGSSRLNKHGLFARMITLRPDEVARYCIVSVFKRKRVIRVNYWSRMLMFNVPVWIKLPLLTQAVRKEIAQ
jgi:short-subunit dehydrogenase